MRDRGRFIALPSPEEAAAFPATDTERARMEEHKTQAISGTAANVAAKLRRLATEMGVDEMAITTTAYDTVARQNSYALIAKEFGLQEGK
jgi:alkanesulfonate monooxygenase SsuD/methylene tetrahydromethanopterin reductase-like flavin-dependent oxidoreductase (luciferase family)